MTLRPYAGWGDQPEQVAALKADWENVLDNMDPSIDMKDEALILYEQMKNSPAFDSEVKHYLRTDDDRTYTFSLRAIERFLQQDRLDRSRWSQLQQQDHAKNIRHALPTLDLRTDDAKQGGSNPSGGQTIKPHAPRIIRTVATSPNAATAM